MTNVKITRLADVYKAKVFIKRLLRKSGVNKSEFSQALDSLDILMEGWNRLMNK